MASSTIPAFLTTLQTQLQARDGLDGVQIFIGEPTMELPREFVVFTTVELEERAAALGRLHREENYTAHLFVDVLRAGQDAVGTMLRCFEIVAEVENQLRGDPQVGGSVIAAQVNGGNVNQRHSAKDRECQVDLRVAVKARI